MPGDTGKRSTGERFTPPPATVWNNMVDAGAEFARRRLGNPQPRVTEPRSTDLIKVRNESCGDRRRGEVLSICENLITELTPENIWMRAAAMQKDKCFGVLRYDVPGTSPNVMDDDKGRIAELQVSGVCLAWVNVASLSHRFATPVWGDVVFVSADDGPVDLIWVPSAGLVECVVSIRQSCPAAEDDDEASPSGDQCGEKTCTWTWSESAREWTTSAGCQTPTTTTTTTTTGDQTTTTTGERCDCLGPTTTTTTAECECSQPTFCGDENGQCTVTSCTDEANEPPPCATTTTTTSTTTTSDEGTTTTCDCDYLPPPTPGCPPGTPGGGGGECEWTVLPNGDVVNVSNGCEQGCSCSPPTAPPECGFITPTPCLCPPSAPPPAPCPQACGGNETFVCIDGDWVTTSRSDCIGDCLPTGCFCGFAPMPPLPCTPCSTASRGCAISCAATPTTPDCGVPPTYPGGSGCYETCSGNTTPESTTTTTTTSTTTTGCNTTCLMESGIDIKGECLSPCECGEPSTNDGCIVETPCFATTTTSTTTTTTTSTTTTTTTSTTTTTTTTTTTSTTTTTTTSTTTTTTTSTTTTGACCEYETSDPYGLLTCSPARIEDCVTIGQKYRAGEPCVNCPSNDSPTTTTTTTTTSTTTSSPGLCEFFCGASLEWELNDSNCASGFNCTEVYPETNECSPNGSYTYLPCVPD